MPVDECRDVALAPPESAQDFCASAVSAAVNLTLAEQLRLSAHEIAERKSLLELSPADEAVLASFRSHIVTKVDDIVACFYERQTAIPEIALVIGDVDTLRRLKAALRVHVLELFEGPYDADYVAKRLRLGKALQRMGVAPKIYIAGQELLHRLLDEVIDAASRDDGALAKKRKEALSKVFSFDLQLVFEMSIASLLSVVEAAKEKVERYALGLEAQVAARTRELEQLSRIDPLTGLGNKAAFAEHLRREFSAMKRYGRPLSLLFIDLNGFKAVNDGEGHLIGDRLLSGTAAVIRHSIRDADIACRFGGDEFCILLPNSDSDAARIVCARITAAFDTEIGAKVSLSIGIAEALSGSHKSEDDFVQAADAAMYVAKTRARVVRQHVLELAPREDGAPAERVEPERGSAPPSRVEPPRGSALVPAAVGLSRLRAR